ncbi:uncharacterized protein PG986_011173 [Apiospora aurea]|uniref:Secreted protein n=1 Tax=Apiospora aurea TaxID=335848 RepID=A0ABR1Q4I6_9PEZI
MTTLHFLFHYIIFSKPGLASVTLPAHPHTLASFANQNTSVTSWLRNGSSAQRDFILVSPTGIYKASHRGNKT